VAVARVELMAFLDGLAAFGSGDEQPSTSRRLEASAGCDAGEQEVAR
jgi:hypothetical protein